MTKNTPSSSSAVAPGTDAKIPEPGLNDVLLGRGGGANGHEGNRRFRKLVAQRKGEYVAAEDLKAKASIANEIYNAVTAENGKFLQKTTGGNGKDCWAIVDYKSTLRKVQQALRENNSKPPPPPAVAVPRPEISIIIPPHNQGTKQNGDDHWETMFMLLVEFKATNKHVCPKPQESYRGKPIGIWVTNQRVTYSLKQQGVQEGNPMTAERVARLEAIGFVWDEDKEPRGEKKPPLPPSREKLQLMDELNNLKSRVQELERKISAME
jgi:hypothetical protein